MSTTLVANATTSNVLLPVLCVAIELSMKKWKIGILGRSERNPSVHEISGDDWTALMALIDKAKQRLGLPAQTRVLACFEAGRHGHYPYRMLKKLGIDVHEWASNAIEKPSRKQAKTDRLDVRRLVLQLRRTLDEDVDPYAVNVPPEDVEAARRIHRERDHWVKVKTQHELRFESLLVSLGATLVKPKPSTRVEKIKDCFGLPLPESTQAELQRLQDQVLLAKKHIRAVESIQISSLKNAREGKAVEHARMVEQVWQLMELLGVGLHTAWPAVFEAFGWRDFKNARQVGGFMGLTATPFDSGNSSREQGISKCGPPKLRAMMVELAWRWIRHQPDTELTQWFQERFGIGKASRKRGIVALARKLSIVLWRYLEHGVVPEGVRLKEVRVPSRRHDATVSQEIIHH
jgi:transposase